MRIIRLLLFFISANMFCQVGINTTNPEPSSILDINSNDKGILIPRVEITNLYDSTSPILNPAHGLMVFNTYNLSGQEEGFYYWNEFIENGRWIKVGARPKFSISNKQLSANFIQIPTIDYGRIQDIKLDFIAHDTSAIIFLSASGRNSVETIGDIYFRVVKTFIEDIPITPVILGGTATQLGGLYEDLGGPESSERWNCSLVIMINDLNIGSKYSFEIESKSILKLGTPSFVRIIKSIDDHHLTLTVIQ
jgi:hypothetical protein